MANHFQGVELMFPLLFQQGICVEELTAIRWIIDEFNTNFTFFSVSFGAYIFVFTVSLTILGRVFLGTYIFVFTEPNVKVMMF